MTNENRIEYLTKLARIEMDEVGQQKLEKDLSDILNFVEKLKEVDTENILPVNGGGELQNIQRPDEQISRELEDKKSNLLNQAPSTKDGYIKVRAVFE